MVHLGAQAGEEEAQRGGFPLGQGQFAGAQVKAKEGSLLQGAAGRAQSQPNPAAGGVLDPG